MSGLCATCANRVYIFGGKHCKAFPSLPFTPNVSRCDLFRERTRHPHRFPSVSRAKEVDDES